MIDYEGKPLEDLNLEETIEFEKQMLKKVLAASRAQMSGDIINQINPKLVKYTPLEYLFKIIVINVYSPKKLYLLVFQTGYKNTPDFFKLYKGIFFCIFFYFDNNFTIRRKIVLNYFNIFLFYYPHNLIHFWIIKR